jgi:hypothetical protein
MAAIRKRGDRCKSRYAAKDTRPNLDHFSPAKMEKLGQDI